MIELPPGDADFSLLWWLIKTVFAKRLPETEWRSKVRQRRGERGIWQRRFCEHLIRDEAYRPYSTFHRLVERGVYAADWAGARVPSS